MNDQLGLGVMISRLGGNKHTVEAHDGAVGKVIKEAKMEGDRLVLRFTDGTGITAYDDGQSCCESRYMTTDDALDDFVGATFNGMEIRDAQKQYSDYGVHEVQFLLVNTSKGVFTLETHNEHNGYYSGFAIVIRAFGG